MLNVGFIWDWLGGLALAFGLTFGIGALIFQNWMPALLYVGMATAGGMRIAWTIKQMPDS